MWIKCLGFDTDGIIVNADPVHFDAFNKTLSRRGIAEVHEEEYKAKYMASDDKNFFREYLSTIAKSAPGDKEIEDLVRQKSKIFDQMMQESPPEFYPGIIESIKRMKQSKIRLFDVTGSLRNEAVAHFRRGDIEDCLEVIITAEDTEKRRPDPEPYLKALEVLDEKSEIDPRDCVVTEDLPDGVLSAKRAGCYVLGVTNTTDAKELWEAGADIVVKEVSPRLYERLIQIESRPSSRLEILSSVIEDVETLPDIIDIGDSEHIYISKADQHFIKDSQETHPISQSGPVKGSRSSLLPFYRALDYILDLAAHKKRPVRQLKT